MFSGSNPSLGTLTYAGVVILHSPSYGSLYPVMTPSRITSSSIYVGLLMILLFSSKQCALNINSYDAPIRVNNNHYDNNSYSKGVADVNPDIFNKQLLRHRSKLPVIFWMHIQVCDILAYYNNHPSKMINLT